uniref:ubiquitinyl hydrolase 1 n=1 Tax=Parastrongyloides trichosuri TaxID=131310 RepID=A0A0N4ZIC7_PARTI
MKPKERNSIDDGEDIKNDDNKPSSSNKVLGHRQTPSTASSISRLSASNSSYAFILPNLDSFIPEFKLFLEKEMIELSVLRRLESSGHLNWWCTMDATKSQKLFPLSTTGDGNCLMHAISLGIWGVHDSQLALRNAVWNLLTNNKKKENLKRRWRWSEEKNNKQSGLIFSEEEWEREWNEILEIASCKTKRSKDDGKCKVSDSLESIDKDSVSSSNTIPPLSDDIIYESLETIHVYALANVLRRPIIVVADTILRNAAGEELSPINFGGIYLPLEWPASMCHRSPLVLCYDSSHFSPLVAMKQATSVNTCLQAIPITDKNRNLLPVHFSVDPGKDYKWSDSNIDLGIKKEIEKNQTIENHIALIGEYMDIVRMDLKKGSKKKSVPITTGNVTVPEKLLTLAAGSCHSNYELKSNTNKSSNTQTPETPKNSRIFKEIIQHFFKFKKFGKSKHRKSKSCNEFEVKSFKVKASELRQSNCVLTVLLHNYVHQHTDYMVKMYIRNAKERFDAYRKSLYTNFSDNGTAPKAHTLPRSRISRSFSFANATVSCINADCEKNATPALYFLCNDCFDKQKKQMMEENYEIPNDQNILNIDKKNESFESSETTSTTQESTSDDEKSENEMKYIAPSSKHCIPPKSLISQHYIHKHLKNCHEEGTQEHSHGGWSATKISPTSYTGVGSY